MSLAPMLPDSRPIASWEQLRNQLADPPAAMRIQPLLRLNDAVDERQLREQLLSLKAQGFGGAFTYCERFSGGSPVRFLSEAWWRVVRATARSCAELGLEFWIYDEEDWPSGSAAGRLLEQHPDLVWKYLAQTTRQQSGPARVSLDLGAFPAGARVIAAFAWQADEAGRIHAETLHALPRQHAPEGEVALLDASGEWTIGLFAAVPGCAPEDRPFPDVMDPRVTRSFIELVYRPHLEQLRAEPGCDATLRGFFTDEPHLLAWAGYALDATRIERAFPFSPALHDAYYHAQGRPLEPDLPFLFHDVAQPRTGAPDPMQIRCHYYAACQARLLDHFDQLAAFCEEHGLQLTGHLWPEDMLAQQLVALAGNPQQIYRRMHIPGIDWVIPFGPAPFTLPANAIKNATSIAHLQGKPRVACESFAGCGWGVSFEELLHVINWEHVNGINMQIPISYKHSLRGEQRATFYPPGLSYQQPWWGHARAFADYEARVCALVASGTHVAQLLMLFPEVDLWGLCHDYAELDRRNQRFNALGDRLRDRGYDYDLLDDEALLNEVRYEAGRFHAGEESFEVLILPQADSVRLATLRRIEGWARDGARILFVGGLPRHSLEHGREDASLRVLVEGLLGVGCQARAAQGLAFVGEALPGVAFAPDVANALERLVGWIRPAVYAANLDYALPGCHRRLADADLYLVFNNSAQQLTTDVTLATPGHAEQIDLFSGEMARPSTAYTIKPQGTTLALAFQPFELLAILLHPTEQPLAQRESWEAPDTIPLDGPWQFELEPTLDDPHVAWNFADDAERWGTPPALPAAPSEAAPGDWAELGLGAFSGIGHYRRSFELPALEPELRVVLELGRAAVSAQVFVNGASQGILIAAPWSLEITAALRPGPNLLHVAVANTLANYYASFEPIASQPIQNGGDVPQRRVSGLLGPVRLVVHRTMQ